MAPSRVHCGSRSQASFFRLLVLGVILALSMVFSGVFVRSPLKSSIDSTPRRSLLSEVSLEQEFSDVFPAPLAGGDAQTSSPSTALAPDALPRASFVRLDVPFTSQAPFANWNRPYDEACEEASLLMVEYFLRGQALSHERADRELVALTGWVAEQGLRVDVSAYEAGKIAERYFGRKFEYVRGDEVSTERIRTTLREGFPVILPVAGRLLNNPHFSNQGPLYHMLVVEGFDERGFFANDPGTRFGDGYWYSDEVLMGAIHEWSGSKASILKGEKAMLLVK